MTTSLTVAANQDRITRALRVVAGRQASREADYLLTAVLKQPPFWLDGHPRQPFTTSQRRTLDRLLARRQTGEPLAYLLGTMDFCGLTLRVNRQTLIPRPETELLVELVVKNKALRRVADIGTGSGAIAIALAVARPDLTVWATDQSAAALRVARANAGHYRLAARITFKIGDLLAPLQRQNFDAVLANPPYLTSAEYRANPLLRFEPKTALISGRDGLTHYRRLLRQLAARPQRPRWLYLEIGAGQGHAIKELFKKLLPEYTVSIKRDLSRRCRFIVATLTSPHSP
ncbi:MAG: peptide chain release factor N(5)-glutamine methyltransferase [Patescibacteria group bacterium]